jgi:hypothetical protein
MSWIAIISTIIEALLPILTEWLNSLLRQSAQELANEGSYPESVSPAEGVRLLFSRTRQKMTMWQWLWHGAKLNRMERVMTRKSESVWNAAKQSQPVELSWGEIREINGE